MVMKCLVGKAVAEIDVAEKYNIKNYYIFGEDYYVLQSIIREFNNKH
jgi:hypothetical protein